MMMMMMMMMMMIIIIIMLMMKIIFLTKCNTQKIECFLLSSVSIFRFRTFSAILTSHCFPITYREAVEGFRTCFFKSEEFAEEHNRRILSGHALNPKQLHYSTANFLCLF